MARPLSNLLKKNAFKWSPEDSSAFEQLKFPLTTAPVLALPNFFKQFVVESYACGVGVDVVLMKEGQPIAFFSKTLAPRHHHLSV